MRTLLRGQKPGTVEIKRKDIVTDLPTKVILDVPAWKIDMDADSAPLFLVARELVNSAATTVRLEKESEQRKITARLRNVSPGSFIAGIGLLLRSGPQFTLQPTATQKERSAEWESLPESLRREIELSWQLRPQLIAAMSASQQQSLLNGESITLTVGNLPAGMRSSLTEFVNLRRGDIALNMGRIAEFKIAVTTTDKSLYGTLGLIGFDKDGMMHVW